MRKKDWPERWMEGNKRARKKKLREKREIITRNREMKGKERKRGKEEWENELNS